MTTPFDDYWKLRMHAATSRLDAARALIQHKPTRGAVAEETLRSLLREFLPHRCGIGTGFALSAMGTSSAQLDVLVYDQLESAPIYRDQDLVVVPPDAALIAIEVKSQLTSDALGEAFSNIASLKALNAHARGLVVGFASAKTRTFKKHLPELIKGNTHHPDQILCLDEKLFIIKNTTTNRFDGYQLDDAPTQQLINEVLSAGKVSNLQPYLPSLKLSRRPVFSVK